jgi:hypothetical protein
MQQTHDKFAAIHAANIQQTSGKFAANKRQCCSKLVANVQQYMQ